MTVCQVVASRSHGLAHRTDVTTLPILTKTFADVANDFGQIDGCITAAGVVLSKPFIDHEWDETVRIELVNVRNTAMK